MKQNRIATLYDAVAGRVNSDGFNRATRSTETPALPEHVLFRSAVAPELTEEQDVDLDNVYWASEKLQPNQELPESDILKAIHEYCSDFYSKTSPDHGESDFKSLDGTALLAMGILLEEELKKALGETGDFAFLEAADAEFGGAKREWIGGEWKRSVVEDSERALQMEARAQEIVRAGAGSIDQQLKQRFLAAPLEASNQGAQVEISSDDADSSDESTEHAPTQTSRSNGPKDEDMQSDSSMYDAGGSSGSEVDDESS